MRRVILIAMLSVATSASASTSAAWDQMNRRVDRACVAMSGLARPELLAQRISFSDAIGTEVRMLRGADARGRQKRLLCAYNRATGRAEIHEADAWNGPAKRP